MSISIEDFNFVADLVRDEAGIILQSGKEYLLELRLGPLAQDRGFPSITEMIRVVRGQSQANGIHQDMVDAMTTNETSFFRDLHPFTVLKQHVIPEIIQRKQNFRRMNIWCCAGSSGQEPYSIAILLHEHFPMLKDWSINILSSDISDKMLERCRQGRFNQLEVNRGLPASLLVKYFRKDGNWWIIDEKIRNSVEVRKVNLLKPLHQIPIMDIIFIRNVLIYFNIDTKKLILQRLSTVMSTDSYLFLGGTESLVTIVTPFEWFRMDKTSYYKLKKNGE